MWCLDSGGVRVCTRLPKGDFSALHNAHGTVFCMLAKQDASLMGPPVDSYVCKCAECMGEGARRSMMGKLIETDLAVGSCIRNDCKARPLVAWARLPLI